MLTLGIAWSFHTDPGDHMAKPLASRPTELGLQRTTRTCTEAAVAMATVCWIRLKFRKGKERVWQL